jgi:hypothetical protein
VFFKNTAESAGNVNVNEWLRPCKATGAASTPPTFPHPPPPETEASLFKTSCQ